MKHILFAFACLFVLNITFSQTVQLDDSVKIIKEFDYIYVSGDFYLAGQPTLEEFEYLQKEGVKTVINLRSESENEEFNNEAFNEAKLVKKLGMKYISIPVSGREDYNPETLEKFAKALKSYDGKVLIHCRSAGRATYFTMAWLMKYHDYSPEKAVEFGEQIRYFNYLEALMGDK